RVWETVRRAWDSNRQGLRNGTADLGYRPARFANSSGEVWGGALQGLSARPASRATGPGRPHRISGVWRRAQGMGIRLHASRRKGNVAVVPTEASDDRAESWSAANPH